MANVEFHFDFGSPNAYLAHLVIPEIEQREINIRADVEDADLERGRRIGVLQERGDLFLLARIERAAGDSPARRLDLGDQRRQLLAPPTPGEDGEPFGREFLGDGAADKVAGADYRHGSLPVFQWSLLPVVQWFLRLIYCLFASDLG